MLGRKEIEVVTHACLLQAREHQAQRPAGPKGRHAAQRLTAPPVRHGLAVDFAHLKRQLPIARVLDQLSLRLRGRGPQRRGQTFSVHVDDHVFHCFDPACQKRGDVIDLWVSAKAMSLREAALDLVRTFNLEAAPAAEQRRGHG